MSDPIANINTAELNRIIDDAVSTSLDGLTEDIKRITRSRVQQLVGVSWQGHPTGAISKYIVERCESLVLEDAYWERVNRIIEEELDEATREAIRLILKSKTRKALFTVTGEPS